jgi:hypothetical protein
LSVFIWCIFPGTCLVFWLYPILLKSAKFISLADIAEFFVTIFSIKCYTKMTLGRWPLKWNRMWQPILKLMMMKCYTKVCSFILTWFYSYSLIRLYFLTCISCMSECKVWAWQWGYHLFSNTGYRRPPMNTNQEQNQKHKATASPFRVQWRCREQFRKMNNCYFICTYFHLSSSHERVN